MTNLIEISWDDCVAHVRACFENAGASKDDARLVAEALVLAEVDGQKGHGLSRVPSYLAGLRSGKINTKPNREIEQNKPAWLEVNADFGFAYGAIDAAFNPALRMVRTQGAGMVSIKHSHHAGVLGHHVERYANAGVIAIMFANTPAAMAPWGGSKAVFGTNPIAFACPRVEGAPLVIDLSLSKVARGKIMRANQEHEPIPDGWALDAQGQATKDPKAALEGTMLPAGDAKGAALALIVELMTAGITGSNFAYQASSFFDEKGEPPNVAQTLWLITPNETQLAHFEKLFEAILSQDNTRLQGSNRIKKRENAKARGLNISQQDFEVWRKSS